MTTTRPDMSRESTNVVFAVIVSLTLPRQLFLKNAGMYFVHHVSKSLLTHQRPVSRVQGLFYLNILLNFSVEERDLRGMV